MDTETSHDLTVARVATRQHGNITRRQLLACGLDDAAIAHRVRTGRLYRVHRGVYSVGRPPRTPLERAAAAVLACAPTGVLSHSSAMTLWGFWKRWDTPFEVTVTRDRRPTGITVHRSAALIRHDIRTQLGIRTTSPARTLFDTAPRLSQRQRSSAVKNALVSPFMTAHQLADLLTRHPHHPATKLLAPLVAIPNQRYRSGLEVDFPAWCRDWGLPIPTMNHPIPGGYTADAYFPQHHLIVELDSHEYHDNPVSFETDRDRDADTLQAGIATVRITPERLTKTPRTEATRLKRILKAREPDS